LLKYFYHIILKHKDKYNLSIKKFVNHRALILFFKNKNWRRFEFAKKRDLEGTVKKNYIK